MREPIRGRPEPSWGRLLGSLIGGIVATIAMSGFQHAWNAASYRMNRNCPDGNFHPLRDSQPVDIDTSKILVNRIADLAGHKLSELVARRSAVVLHYGIGAAGGYAYSLLGNVAFPRSWEKDSLAAGVAFGAGLFLVADLAAVPLMGLPNKGAQSPLGTRLYGVSSRVVYGLTLAETSKVLDELL